MKTTKAEHSSEPPDSQSIEKQDGLQIEMI